MADITLVYFDFAGSRGEECRLALHLAGVDFFDDRIKGPAFAERRSSTPFGALPVLEVAGKGKLAQSNAILRYVGRSYGLHPSDPWEAAQHDALMDACEDLRHRLDPTMRLKDDTEKKRLREELASGYLPQWAACVERQLGTGPFVAGQNINVVDLKLFIIWRWFASGSIDHIPSDLFSRHEKLAAHHRAVESHPGVVQWYSR